jgi:hypothetical protein
MTQYLDNSELMRLAGSLGWTHEFLEEGYGQYRDAVRSARAFLIARGYTVKEDVYAESGRIDTYINILQAPQQLQSLTHLGNPKMW